MSKKGVELTMNTIVIAALALIVMVVLVIIFTGGFGDISRSFSFLKGKVISKGDCIVIGNNPAKDKDGDGYLDDGKYKVTYTDENGKTQEKDDCACDSNKNDKEVHQDPFKYC